YERGATHGASGHYRRQQRRGQLAAHLLEMLGHEVRVSYSGPEGLKTVQDWLPEWVLCDIGLPGLDGWEIAKELRKDPRTSGLHLVAVTSFGTLDDRARSREAGFELHLVKPVEFGRLRELLTTT